MQVHIACMDTLNITIFHNGKNMLIKQQFVTSYVMMHYTLYIFKHFALCRFENIVMATIHHIFFNYIGIIDKKNKTKKELTQLKFTNNNFFFFS